MTYKKAVLIELIILIILVVVLFGPYLFSERPTSDSFISARTASAMNNYVVGLNV